MSGRLGRMVQMLLHVEDTPHRTALAFGVGVWIAFCPLLGIHTLMAFAIAFLFRLSRGPLLLGAYINNPWTLAPLFMAGTLLGCSILGVSTHGLEMIDWSLHGWAFYEALLAGGAGRGEAAVREALEASRRSVFTVFEREVPLT